MTTSASRILNHLRAVDAERARRVAEPGLDERVKRLKKYQQRRFSLTYADLLQSPRYGAAARFFLEELYGPEDFRRRDSEFARVVPALVRLFPAELVETVAALASLHALSESLDTAMAEQLEIDQGINGMTYTRAWKRSGSRELREGQISGAVDVAARLDRLTHRPLLRNTLRLMRAPARGAGLGELQKFLEAGFDTFREMKGAQEFIASMDTRERLLASSLFNVSLEPIPNASLSAALRLLP